MGGKGWTLAALRLAAGFFGAAVLAAGRAGALARAAGFRLEEGRAAAARLLGVAMTRLRAGPAAPAVGRGV